MIGYLDFGILTTIMACFDALDREMWMSHRVRTSESRDILLQMLSISGIRVPSFHHGRLIEFVEFAEMFHNNPSLFRKKSKNLKCLFLLINVSSRKQSTFYGSAIASLSMQ